MRAVDTNVLARYYLRDDASQSKIAAAILAAGDVFVAKTVLLELEWILRYVAEQPSQKVVDCLAHLLALPGITVEDHERVDVALEYCRRGLDFADALLLTASDTCSEVLTFDRRYVQRAAKLRSRPTVRLPKA